MSTPNPYAAPTPLPSEDPPLVAQLAIDGEGMTIEFEQTMDDLMAGQYYVLREMGIKMPGPWTWAAIMACGVLSVSAMIVCMSLPGGEDLLGVAIIGFAFTLFFALFLPYKVWYSHWNVRRVMLKLANKGRNYNLTGLRRVTISPLFLIYSSPLSQSAMRWVGIERILVEPDNLFILVSTLQPMVLPRRAFNSEQHFREFALHAEKYRVTSVGAV